MKSDRMNRFGFHRPPEYRFIRSGVIRDSRPWRQHGLREKVFSATTQNRVCISRHWIFRYRHYREGKKDFPTFSEIFLRFFQNLSRNIYLEKESKDSIYFSSARLPLLAVPQQKFYNQVLSPRLDFIQFKDMLLVSDFDTNQDWTQNCCFAGQKSPWLGETFRYEFSVSDIQQCRN